MKNQKWTAEYCRRFDQSIAAMSIEQFMAVNPQVPRAVAAQAIASSRTRVRGRSKGQSLLQRIAAAVRGFRLGALAH